MSQERINELTAQIKELEKQRDAELEALRYRPVTADTQRLAIQLHAMLCRWNHTDGCCWYYSVKNNGKENEAHDWNEYSHEEYLEKAVVFEQFCADKGISTQDALELIKLIK